MFGPPSDISPIASKQHYSFAIFDVVEKVVSSLKKSIYVTRIENIETLIPHSVYLTAITSYTLVVKKLDVNTYYDTDGNASCTIIGVTVNCEASPLCTTGTDKEKWQITGTLFSKEIIYTKKCTPHIHEYEYEQAIDKMYS